MMLHFLYDITNEVNGHKNCKLVILASLKSETMGKLIKINTRFASFDIKFTRLGFENA